MIVDKYSYKIAKVNKAGLSKLLHEMVTNPEVFSKMPPDVFAGVKEKTKIELKEFEEEIEAYEKRQKSWKRFLPTTVSKMMLWVAIFYFAASLAELIIRRKVETNYNLVLFNFWLLGSMIMSRLEIIIYQNKAR